MSPEIKTIKAFAHLGIQMRDYCQKWNSDKGDVPPDFQNAVDLAQAANPWFVEENILFALEQWGGVLTEENLREFLSSYSPKSGGPQKTVGIVMAGNVPLVGFHDFLCVLLSGHRALAKLSSQDRHLMPFLASILIQAEPGLSPRIQFVEDLMKGYDAVIATGSNNTGRYFEHYFGKGPHIIRKNRNSVAILSGKEDLGQLRALGSDIFGYFGLGCRNVSKIYVPKGYDFDLFFKGIQDRQDVVNHSKYANNYDYNRAIFAMNGQRFLDNGFVLLKEEEELPSPISVLHYSQYGPGTDPRIALAELDDQIQCTVSGSGLKGEVPFGQAQNPGLADYADGVDTMEFLLGL